MHKTTVWLIPLFLFVFVVFKLSNFLLTVTIASEPKVISITNTDSIIYSKSYNNNINLHSNSKYELCFNYNTSGNANPSLKIETNPSNNTTLYLPLPRNTWGLGDACFLISPFNDIFNANIILENHGANSSFKVSNLDLKEVIFSPTHLFYFNVSDGKGAAFKLKNNYLTFEFLFPLFIFMLIWLTTGIIIAFIVPGIGVFSLLVLSPLVGVPVLSFTAYILSLFGLYNKFVFFPVIIFIDLLILKLFWKQIRGRLLELSSINYKIYLKNIPIYEKLSLGFIFLISISYIYYSFSPFYSTWDGLVSWNKWGLDWAVRELRGNYQFAYPQLIPIFYSIYFKLTGVDNFDPMALSRIGPHIFSTYIDIAVFQLAYLISKHLKVNPFIFITLLVSSRFKTGIGNGYVDHNLATYALATFLLILLYRENKDKFKTQNDKIAFSVIILLVSFGAMFIKQLGIFSAFTALAFLIYVFRFNIIKNKILILLIAATGAVPFLFYTHEIILELYPKLVEIGKYNHYVASVLSQGSTIVSMADDANNLNFIQKIGNKLLILIMGNHFDLKSIRFISFAIFPIITLLILSIFSYICVKLVLYKNWLLLIPFFIFGFSELIVITFFSIGDDIRYSYISIIFIVFIISYSLTKATYYNKTIKVIVISIVVLLSIRSLIRHIPKFQQPALAANHYDTISYDVRSDRFYPNHKTIKDYLVSINKYNFQLFISSNFVSWPNYIFTNRIPTSKTNIHPNTDDIYYIQLKECPKNSTKIDINHLTFNPHNACRFN